MSRNRKRKLVRRGATAVEFAMVSPILLIMVLGCFVFCRAMLLNSFVEEAAFRGARIASVPGATVAEGIAEVNAELATVGVTDATVLIEPMVGGVVQSEINDSTDRIRVIVTAQMSHGLNTVLGNMVIEKIAEINTERFNY